MAKKPTFTVIEGGKGKDPSGTPRASEDFDLASFMLADEPAIDYNEIFNSVTPDMYGKTIDGVTYGDPTKEPVILYIDESGKPVFDF
jgi:hypothetical protein